MEEREDDASARVVYLMKFDRREMKMLDTLPNHENRCLEVQSLLEAFGLLSKCKTMRPVLASKKFMTLFHDERYLDAIERVAEAMEHDGILEDDVIEKHLEELETYGLIGDCMPFRGMWKYCKLVAGCALVASRTLIGAVFKNYNQKTTSLQTKILTTNQKNSLLEQNMNDDLLGEGVAVVVVNWMGGRHHAKKDGASGFCYVNDVVLSVVDLSGYFARILTVDVDLHHGDGVEEAFLYSDRVYCVSFHIHQPGFFPGTGSIEDIGKQSGRYYTTNVPLNYGMTDDQFIDLFNAIVPSIIQKFRPQTIVLICGADCLNGDPLGGMCLTYDAILACIQTLLAAKIPLLILGGGGYHLPNVSRLYALSTALVLGTSLPPTIPPHPISYFDSRTHYLNPQHTPNLNSPNHLLLTKKKILSRIQKLPNTSSP